MSERTIASPSPLADSGAAPRGSHNGWSRFTRSRWKWVLLLVLAVATFSWRIVFTGQFTISEDWEAVNEGYADHQFMVGSCHKGIAPLWDPYSWSGRTFVGGMQSGVFYPLKLLLDLWPLGNSGLLSDRLLMQYHVLARLLAALFMFLLAAELGITKPIAAFVSAICFGLGGLVGSVGGGALQLLDSCVWLPLVLLFMIRALRSSTRRRGVLYALLGGFWLAMTVLAGSLHIPIMDVLVILSVTAYLVLQSPEDFGRGTTPRGRLLWAAEIVSIIGVMSFAASAVQLFPAVEFSPLAMHWSAQAGALEKTRYAVMTISYNHPSSVFAFLFGAAPGSAEFNLYLGVLPFFLAVIGAWVYRNRPWVKYLIGLEIVTFLYTLGPFSLINGLGYLGVPFLDKAPEADRVMYLTQFAFSLLAGFGVQALFTAYLEYSEFLRRATRFLGGVVLFLVASLTVPTLYGKPEVNEWFFVSLLFFIGAWGAIAYVVRGHRGPAAQFLMVGVILCDLYAFHWDDFNRADRKKQGNDYQEQLIQGPGRDLATFFRSQPGLFRVHMDGEIPNYLNLGPIFEVQTTGGWTGASLFDYLPFTWFPKGLDALNVRYIAVAGKDHAGQPVFTTGPWKVYENPTALPRGWIVHQLERQTSIERIKARLQQPDFDLRYEALVGEAVDAGRYEKSGNPESVNFQSYTPNQLELTAQVEKPGLLVLSELYYPGWQATVNGSDARIYKVDGILRGLLVSPGANRIIMSYRPRSVLYGAILSSIAALISIAAAVMLIRMRHRDDLFAPARD